MTVENTHGSTRGDFFKQAAGAALLVAGAGVGAGIAADAAEARTFIPGTYSFEVGGVNWGQLATAGGGDWGYVVTSTNFSSSARPDKSLGQPTWDPFTIGVGGGMAPEMYEWIKASFDKSPPAIDGAIVVSDASGIEIGRRSFSGAQMTSFSTPGLPNSPYSFPAMTLTFEADSVGDETSSTGRLVRSRKSKSWETQSFTFHAPGLSSRIASVDSFTWKRGKPVGGMPAPITEMTTLSCRLKPAAVPSWQQWYDNFALGGNSSDERTGLLSVWGSTHTTPRFAWTVGGLGIFELRHRGGIDDPGPDVGMVAQMYVERASCQCNHL